jgi:signal transduction histidine kinase
MNNLVSNAIKYQNLRIDQSWVKVHAATEGTVCKISIEDNGIGIAEEFQGRIFEMFFRATERSSGSGLGLYIVKEIIERMNGSITMKSEEGKGTRFEIVVPAGK